ncbi:MAG: M28 family metallopeptidase [Pseudomonadota bacterium]
MHFRVSAFTAAVFSALLAGCATDDAPPAYLKVDEAARAAAAAVTGETPAAAMIKTDVDYLAADARAGREAGDEGYDAAARYVAARFAAEGLKPGAGRRWFQTVTLRAATRDMDAAAMSLTGADGETTAFAHPDDFLIGQSMATPSFDVSGALVFVGHGVVAPEEGYDDYGDIDVAGKIVVAFSGAPQIFDSEKYAFYRSGDYKMKEAAARGAVGYISLPDSAGLKRFPWARRLTFAERARFTWVGPDGVGDIAAPEIRGTAQLSAAGAEKLLAGEARDFAALLEIADAGKGGFEPFALTKSASLAGASTFEEKKSANVAGIIKGGDPALRDEVVVLTAHLDHVGVHEPRGGGEDKIHNGALDNAMGVATLLNVARSFKNSAPPKRTLMFLAVTAEEKGLLGADYFVHYPTIDADRMVANVNLDMPLTLFEFTDVIAFGAERSSLGEIVRDAASAADIAVIPDPIPEQGVFTRSDHYRFVEKGIPSVFLFLGFGNGGDKIFADFMRDHYHRPSDETSLPIDYASAARFADLNYRVARAVADHATRPVWTEGDFFGERFGPSDAAPADAAAVEAP